MYSKDQIQMRKETFSWSVHEQNKCFRVNLYNQNFLKNNQYKSQKNSKDIIYNISDWSHPTCMVKNKQKRKKYQKIMKAKCFVNSKYPYTRIEILFIRYNQLMRTATFLKIGDPVTVLTCQSSSIYHLVENV